MTYTSNSQSAAEMLFERKHQLFLNFSAHSSQAQNSVMYLNQKLSAATKSHPLQSTFNYLDVGCGYGNKTLSVIQIIQNHCPVKAVALDPSEQLLAIFKKEIKDQSIDIVCSTWEAYQSASSFHFISSIHAFYYIDKWEQAISKMMSALDGEGKICIALRSNDPVCQFKDYFFQRIYKDGRKERNCEELCELLNKLNINYELDYVDSALDINDCLLQNEKGEQLIEFLLRQPYHKLHSVKDEITSYLEKNQKNGYLTHRDGYVWISNQ